MRRDPEVHSSARPWVRLLGAPALLSPYRWPFADERRWRLAAVLALGGDGGLRRDALAALFWPEHGATDARRNLRKLVLELRALALPGLEVDGDALRWPVPSDAAELLRAHRRGDIASARTLLEAGWAEPLAGLGAGGSTALEDWLAARRAELAEAWCALALAAAREQLPQDAPQAERLARQALAAEPQHEAAAALLQAALAAQGRACTDTRPGANAAAAPAAAEPQALLGRDEALVRLRALAGDAQVRLVSLTGPGGIGKSALMLALLRTAAASMDRVPWVALEDLDEAAQVLPRIARELGVALPATGDGWAEVVAALQARPTRLLLDNAEHLPGLPALLQRLLDAAPALRCVVTTRRRLGLAGEVMLPLEPLAPPAARALFLRAARAAPWRRPLAEDDPLLAELLATLGGLPLALLLAATFTRHLALPALLAELRRSGQPPPAASSPDEHPAHASLGATFEHSWRLLAPPLRPVLAALSQAAGTLPLGLAQQVAGADATAIAALAEASLLVLDADGRVSMHPALRPLAAARLSAAQARAARRRHLRAIAAHLAPWQDLEAGGGDGLRDLEPLLPDILAAWDAALDAGDAAALAAMAEALSLLHQTGGGIARVLPRFERAEAWLAGARQPAALARIALEHASLRFWLGGYEAVERSARVALRAARAARLARPRRQALNVLALAAMRQGRNEEGAAWLGQALAAARRDGAASEAMVYAGNLCALLRELGRLGEARALAMEALEGYRAAGNALGQISVLNELGLMAHAAGELDAAFDWYAQALRAAGSGLALRRPVLLSHQASVRLDQQRPEEALALLQEAAVAVARAGARAHAPVHQRLLAEALLACGRLDEALAQLREAARQLLPLDASSRCRGLLCSCAAAALALGRDEAAAVLALAAQAARGGGAPVLRRYRQTAERALAALDPARRARVHTQAAEPAAVASCLEELLGCP